MDNSELVSIMNRDNEKKESCFTSHQLDTPSNSSRCQTPDGSSPDPPDAHLLVFKLTRQRGFSYTADAPGAQEQSTCLCWTHEFWMFLDMSCYADKVQHVFHNPTEDNGVMCPGDVENICCRVQRSKEIKCIVA